MEVEGYVTSFAMNQFDQLSNDQTFLALFNAPLDNHKRSGICAGLCMVWVARRIMFPDETPEKRSTVLNSSGSFQFAGRSQDIHIAAAGGGDEVADMVRNEFAEALKAYALRVVGTNVDMADSSAGDMAEMGWSVAEHAGSRCLYNIGYIRGGGHMAASFTLPDRSFNFFDPNIGEYQIAPREAQAFLEAWVNAYEAANAAFDYVCAFEVERS